jgi:hypothetical protein
MDKISDYEFEDIGSNPVKQKYDSIKLSTPTF